MELWGSFAAGLVAALGLQQGRMQQTGCSIQGATLRLQQGRVQLCCPPPASVAAGPAKPRSTGSSAAPWQLSEPPSFPPPRHPLMPTSDAGSFGCTQHAKLSFCPLMELILSRRVVTHLPPAFHPLLPTAAPPPKLLPAGGKAAALGKMQQQHSVL